MISVGEYIRTKDGIIEKIKTFDMQTNIFVDKKGKLQKWMGETVFGDTISDEITKHSKNIIDLIEVGDFVNGFKIYNMEYITYNNRVDLVFTIFKTPIDFTSPYKVIVTWQEKDIKTILTHEMYEQNCYKEGVD